MILGCGTAKTDTGILLEYENFIQKYHADKNPTVRLRYMNVLPVMRQRLRKPLRKWTEQDILEFYIEPQPNPDRRGGYCAFLAFLFFYGYVKPSFRLVVEFPGFFSREHTQATAPLRNKLEQLYYELGYARPSGNRTQVAGAEFNLLISLLLVSNKSLDEVTVEDFKAFEDQYQDWYRPQYAGRMNTHIWRLKKLLIHGGLLKPSKIKYVHEERLAKLSDGPIRSAILYYFEWCKVRNTPSTIVTRRNALLDFFVWFHETYPGCSRLDDVTRHVALAYGKHLKALREQGQRSLNYCNDLYREIRLFYEFSIQEHLDTSPNRNPFGLKDVSVEPQPVRRYLPDNEVRKVLDYCEKEAPLLERTIVIILLHTGVRASELANLKVTDIVEIQGKWKLHVHEGKGLKDRLIPLTPECLAVFQTWKEQRPNPDSEYLFTNRIYPDRLWRGHNVGNVICLLGKKLGIEGLCPHRFRHTFAVTLLNYGMRESALQKVMGHTTVNMTLKYARILDETVERAFTSAVEQMHEGPLSWVPNFFTTEAFSTLAEADTVGWIQLPVGYCRRNPKMHCESDVKCMLCDRFAATNDDLPKLKAMQERFLSLGLQVKADVVAAQIRRLETQSESGFVAIDQIGIVVR
jgi:integrase